VLLRCLCTVVYCIQCISRTLKPVASFVLHYESAVLAVDVFAGYNKGLPVISGISVSDKNPASENSSRVDTGSSSQLSLFSTGWIDPRDILPLIVSLLY